VVVNQMARVDEPDDVWRANVKKLLALTGDIPLGLYECPKPYHRYVLMFSTGA
jgi:4-hydroxy-tetrahydrodipicolinate synthase